MAFHEPGYLLEAQHLVKGIVKGAQVGVDLLGQVARQKAQALAGLHRRSHQQDPPHPVCLKGLHGAGDGEIGLARPGGTNAKVNVVAHHRIEIGLLIRPAGADQGALEPHGQFRALRVRVFEQGLDARGLQLQVNGLGGQDFLRGRGIKTLQDLLTGPYRLALANEAEEVAAISDLDAQPALDLAQMGVELTGEVGETDVVLWGEPEVEGFGCLGQGGVLHSFRTGAPAPVPPAGNWAGPG